MSSERTVVVGGPRCGKSWFSRDLRKRGIPTFCGDPKSMVKEPEADVTYLPEGLAMEDESTRWIVEHWFTMPGPWVCEGWIMARALRKWLEIFESLGSGNRHSAAWPCDRIIVFTEQRPELVDDLLRGQRSQHKGVMTVWNKISPYFEGMYEERSWSS